MSKSVPGYSVDCSSTGAKSAGRGYSPCLANQPMPGMAFNFDFLSSLGEDRAAPAGSLPPPDAVRP